MSKQDVRIYIDGGTGEHNSIWDLWAVHDHLVRQEYVLLDESTTVIECGAEHNEWAWQHRFPDALRFLLPIQEAANALIHKQYPLQLLVDDALFSVRIPTFRGWSYVIERSPSLINPSWNPVLTNQPMQAWQETSIPLPVSGAAGLFRVRAWASPQD